MRQAETVTFGGGGLDRAAEIRGDGVQLAALWSRSDSRALPVWRGKPLMRGGAPGWVPTAHPVIGPKQADAILLGRDSAKAGLFAVDLSDWSPTQAPATPDSFLDGTEQRHPDLPADCAFVELRREMTRLTAWEAECAATARAILGWHSTHRFCACCGAESAPALAGWQRLCPTCGARHFPRTDPVVIMLITRGNAALLGRSPGWPEGMYSLLAGFVEPGETVEAAVRREVAEEVGVDVGPVGYLASQPWPFPASLMIGCHGLALTTALTPDPTEIEDARWVTREELMAVVAGESAALKPARKGAIAEFLLRRWLADRLD